MGRERYGCYCGLFGVLHDLMSTPNKDYTITMGDNDYLSLVHHKDSSVFLSEFDPHTALEMDLAAWFSKDCYLAQSGYAANVGVMHAVCTKGMHVYVDMFLHMSFYDGLAARGAKLHPFKPNNAADLEPKVKKYGAGLIIVESVYSTSGSFAPLEDIVRIKKEHSCTLVVDESHSFGLFGTQGLGLLHHKNLVADVDYITASPAKAHATRAGIVFTKHAVFIKENSFPFIFSSGLVQNDIVRIRAMWDMNKVAKLVGGRKNTPCAIVGLAMKNEEKLSQLYRFLSDKGILAAPFLAPATSPDHPFLRFTVHCDVSMEDAKTVEEWYATSKARL
ncbi:pyridoxal phosphate-dependent transferase [Aspergillus pseudoustus]|uniref:Pyridoxal phosphate-dependent transferase n=1 Tax=Aspergillus pseudoustus TaxID=1810923 RepID=A0ABR4KYQ6_9EURO